MDRLQLLIQLFHARVRMRVDQRMVACRVEVSRRGRIVVVSGYSMYTQTNRFLRAIAREVFADEEIEFDLKVLERDCAIQFYEVTESAAQFYSGPAPYRRDLLTEALLGTVVRGYFADGAFVLAQNADGYVGYVPQQMLTPVDTARYLRWKNGPCGIVRKTLHYNGLVIPPAARLIRENRRLDLSGDRWIKTDKQSVKQTDPAEPRLFASLVQHAGTFQNTPYLWGGKTHAGVDCSGFVQSLFLQENVVLPRDANMQAYVGEIVGYLKHGSDLLPGDLVFFMNEEAKVFHVGVYAGSGEYLHSSLSQNVARSSLDPQADNYIERLACKFVFGRRVHIT